VDVLKPFVERAQQIYLENMQRYVLLLIEKRFPSLIVQRNFSLFLFIDFNLRLFSTSYLKSLFLKKFFAGVDTLYATVPRDTIKYQPRYTNLDLSKLIEKYTPEKVCLVKARALERESE
jgi:hypothetical protein